MNHIPVEVLNEIFIKLDLTDKLECTLVCRFWYDTLDRHTLLHTLHISDRVFPKLKQAIERQPHRASQVEFLEIISVSSLGFDKRILCNIFPNLRELVMPTNILGLEITHYLDTPFQFSQATSKLKRIRDSDECELTCQLAMSNMCSNLKSLDVTLSSKYSHVLARLKNMPVLETLALRGLGVKLMDLEMVHDNLPSIKSLRLTGAALLSGEIPHEVTPANLVTEADLQLNYFNGVNDINVHVEFYKYIAKKYPSVAKPTFDKTVSLFRANDSYVRKLYNEGILPLYQHIGSRTDTFEFKRYCDGLDAFRKFDRFGMKLKELTITYVSDALDEAMHYGMDEEMDGNVLRFPLDELVQSQQSKSIQKFILNDIVPASLEMMMNMEALKYLEISFSDSYAEFNEKFTSTIDFDRLVDACPPTLTDLIINSMHLDSGKLPTNVTSIQNLKLVNVKIAEGAVKIAGRNFPELTVLNVEAIIKSKLTISLPNHHLKEVDIEVQFPEYAECYSSVSTMNEGKRQTEVIWPGYKDPLYGTQIHCSRKVDHDFMKFELVDFTCSSVEKSSYFIYHKNNGDEEGYDDDHYIN